MMKCAASAFAFAMLVAGAAGGSVAVTGPVCIPPRVGVGYGPLAFSPDGSYLATSVVGKPSTRPPDAGTAPDTVTAGAVALLSRNGSLFRRFTGFGWEGGWSPAIGSPRFRRSPWSPDGTQLLVVWHAYHVPHLPSWAPTPMGILDVASGEFVEEFETTNDEVRLWYWAPDERHTLLRRSGPSALKETYRTAFHTVYKRGAQVAEERSGGRPESPFLIETRAEKLEDRSEHRTRALWRRASDGAGMYELMGPDTFEEVSVSPDLQHAFVYGRDHTLSLFGTDRPEPLHVVPDIQPWLVLSAWSADSRYFAYTTHADPATRRRSGAPDQLWIVDLSQVVAEEGPDEDRTIGE